MKPLNSNQPGNKCSQSIPATCIPANVTIPNIGQCDTDMVSDILVKLGQKECYLESLLNVSGLDLSCIYTSCPQCQNPTTVLGIFQVLVSVLCTQQSQITALQTCCNKLNAGF